MYYIVVIHAVHVRLEREHIPNTSVLYISYYDV